MLNKLKFILFKQKKQPQHYQWIIHHTRATDRVFFGPFNSLTEVDNFFQNNPEAQRVSRGLELLISSQCPPKQWWYNPDDFLKDNHSYLYK
jgi:hypothetical protein